jgi:hypothetical protein
MAEDAGAHAASPQRALLDLVRRCDVYLLIVGPRYSRPTEDEFDEARRLGRPILVLRQEVDLEPEQAEFLERVAGGWSGGRLWGTFHDASDVGFAVVKALSNLRGGGETAERAPAAQARARELAVGSARAGTVSTRSTARVALAPLVSGPLLDAVALDDALGDAVADLVRAQRLVPQSVGITPHVSREGVTVHGGERDGEPLVRVGADGAIVCEFSVAGSDQFGSMRVDPSQLEAGLRAACAFALATWDRIDPREEVQQVAVVVAIPEPQHKVYGASTGASSIQLGSFSMPNSVVVPEPPLVMRRADVGGEELVRRLVAEVRRVFADAGAAQG